MAAEVQGEDLFLPLIMNDLCPQGEGKTVKLENQFYITLGELASQ